MRPSSFVFFILALLCGYGLLASLEPGNGIGWKLGYGAGCFIFLLLWSSII